MVSLGMKRLAILLFVSFFTFQGCALFQPKAPAPEDANVELGISDIVEKVQALLMAGIEDEDFDDEKKEHKQYISYDISEKVGDRKIIVHVRQRETSNGTEYVADVLCRVTTNKDKAVEKIQIKDTDPDRLIMKLEIALRQIL